MQPDAMTIPARVDDDGVARPAETGPVFSRRSADGALHMRYTARTRSIEWKDDPRRARRGRARSSGCSPARRRTSTALTLEPGMGLCATTCCTTAPASPTTRPRPRLLYRARYYDRVAAPGRTRGA